MIVRDKILPNKAQYQRVEAEIGVPWEMVACLSLRESDCDMRTHLHNGDPLSRRTYHVPAGRPKKGEPPFKWFESAIDALTMPPHSLADVKVWSIERQLYEMERYNGLGYIRHNENSPYVWSWTTEQERGKFVADGRFSGSAWDTQPGCAAILKVLAEAAPEVKARHRVRQATAPPEVVSHATARPRAAAGAGATVATAGGSSKAITQQPDKPMIHHVIEGAMIGLGLLVFIAAAVTVVRRGNLIKAKWG
ncbi:MAG TPA: hypothetical protein VKQ27_20200 [Acetobacteraceae bacterium]|nr:hypothetical protein [Acetobacteraceae bacterium]